MQPQLLLKLSGIDKAFPGVQALSQAGLCVYQGRVMALVGENGAGKSTLMKILTGIYNKDAGSIEYLGQETIFPNPRLSQEAGIGIIHQELNLIGELSIAENIFLGREFTNRFGKIDWAKMYQEADLLLQKLNVSHSSKKLVNELSIGDQQRVEIAKVLSFEARIIIMDEPTDALTDTETEALFAIIRELKKRGCGIVYISHRLKEIFEICDDITVLRDGSLIAEKPIADFTETTLIEAMVGRTLDEQYPHIDCQRGPKILEVKNLSGQGIKQACFELYAGEILGISGLMGSGRTELMKMIYGALPAASGSVLVEDRSIKQTIRFRLDSGIVYISEDRKRDGLILGMSVKENMSLTALKHLSYRYGMLRIHDEKHAADGFIQAFNIKTPSLNQIISKLSGGNQQKVAIARGLMTQPKILILDEPTRGVDVGAKKEIYALINQFKATGLSIIMISSDMPEILGMSDRILVLHEGEIRAEYSRNEATQEKIMAAAVGRTEGYI